jgi:fructose-bisphosphate aldolase class II
MPLCSIADELKKAQAGGYALPLFDTFDMHSADGMVQALEEKRAPAMIALYSRTLEQPNARAFAAYIRARAEDATVPVSLMLDHGNSFEQCMKALRFGFTDVMFDGSQLPLEENIATTRTIARAAHAVGVAVEAELGHVGRGSEYQSYGAQRKGFTDPDAVEHFVAETGVDFLAIAIGTAHGLYEGEPQIDLDLLREIRSRVDIPLVLHGGSGCTEAQYRDVIAAGIAKINITTDLFVRAGQRVVEVAHGEDVAYFDMARAATETFRRRCGDYLDIFGATGQAP